MISVKALGFFAQWVDGGRIFAQVNGYSESGALDWLHYQLANALCGNSLNQPALEVVGGAIELYFETPCFISVTGAPCRITLNGKIVAVSQVYYVPSNSLLSLDSLQYGWINYIAVSSRVNLNRMFDSVCAVKRERIGGLLNDGNSVRVGDRFVGKCKSISKNMINTVGRYTCRVPKAILVHKKSLFEASITEHSPMQIPMHFTYQASDFSAMMKHRFLNSTYTISNMSDKMGMRLDGVPLLCDSQVLTSQPIASGAIQIPGNGQPIVMRNDRQTIGGYPIVGTVSKVGLTYLAQLTAGAKIQFFQQSIEHSYSEYLLLQRAIATVLDKNKCIFNHSN